MKGNTFKSESQRSTSVACRRYAPLPVQSGATAMLRRSAHDGLMSGWFCTGATSVLLFSRDSYAAALAWPQCDSLLVQPVPAGQHST